MGNWAILWMMKTRLFLFFTLVMGISYCGLSAAAMDVPLKTATSLVPVYLAPLPNEEGAELREVLRFDLNHNGSTLVLPALEEVDALLLALPFQSGEFPEALKDKAQYLIKMQVKDKLLSLAVVGQKGKLHQQLGEVPLTGELSMDRRQVHQLADMLHHVLFGSPGVAGSTIIYTVAHPNLLTPELSWYGEIWEADYDGYNARPITREESLCITPCYVPGKTRHSSQQILYTSYSFGQPKIQITSLGPGKPRRLTFLRGNQLMPAVSRQGDKIAFVSDVTGSLDLFLLAYDPHLGAVGRPRQIFTSPHGTQASPTFSPDGKQLAFVSNKDGSPRIYAMKIPAESTRLNQIRPQLISRVNRENTAPSWSPDGRYLAYTSKTDGVRQIWVYDLRTGKEKALTFGPDNKENPCWGPDSRHLVYNTADQGNNELYLLTLDSPLPPVQITNGPGEKRYPNWD